MSDKIIKCKNCGEGTSPFPVKLPNNVNLCYACGVDCGGNKRMKKVREDGFSQLEKEENYPEGKAIVFYCDKHKQEGEKKQEKQEFEEKLNSRKGLFYCHDTFPHMVERKKIEVLNYFKYKEKVKQDRREVELTRYNLKKQFYLIEGVDNLLLEATTPYNDSYEKIVGLNDKITIVPFENDEEPENQNGKSKCDICKKREIKPGSEGVYLGYYHGKKEGSRLHACAECYQEKETEYLQNYGFIYSYRPEDLRKKGTVNNEANTTLLLQYFQKNKVKRIVWDKDKGNLKVEYEHSTTYHSIENMNISGGFPELYEALKYFKKNGKNEITLSELRGSVDSNQTENSQDNKVLLWCSLGHAYTMVMADIIIRYKKSQGYTVYFQTGSDDHGEKIAKKAASLGLTPQQLVDKNLLNQGDIYLGEYQGKYCIACEDYVSDSKVINGDFCPAPNCQAELRKINESAYFLRTKQGENAIEAAKREIFEETNLVVRDLEKIGEENFYVNDIW
nr:7932_t:CDS:2 [Entrophospora candida]